MNKSIVSLARAIRSRRRNTQWGKKIPIFARKKESVSHYEENTDNQLYNIAYGACLRSD